MPACAPMLAVIAVLPNVPRANGRSIWLGVLSGQGSDDGGGCAMTHVLLAATQAITASSAYRCHEPPRGKRIVCTRNVREH